MSQTSYEGVINSMNKSLVSVKWRDNDLDDIKSEIEEDLMNELPLSSIGDVCVPFASNRNHLKSETSVINDNCQNEFNCYQSNQFNLVNYNKSKNGKTGIEWNCDSSDLNSGFEDFSQSKLSISSIGNVCNLYVSNRVPLKIEPSIVNDNCQKEINCYQLNQLNFVNYKETKNEKIVNECSFESDDIEDFPENELPLSSIGAVCIPFVNKQIAVKINTLTINDHYKSEISKNETIVKEYKCDVCDKIFKRRSRIIKHFKTSLCFPDSPNYSKLQKSKHNGIKPHINTNFTFKQGKTKNCLTDSINSHIDDQIKTYSQSVNSESKRSSTENNIDNYCDKYINKNTTFTKGRCTKVNCNPHCLKACQAKPFKCNQCMKTYSNFSTLKKHFLNHERGPFNCKFCDKQFYFNCSLTRHVERKHRISKNYLCSECLKVFYKRSDIKQHIFKKHIKRSENSLQYSCNICSTTYGSSQELSLHKKNHLQKNYYKCDVCPKSFVSSYRLYQHYQWHLGINSFKCQYCVKTFSIFSSYVSHERIHTEVKPYKCNICNKRFTVLSNLSTHSRTHSGLKPFECDICKEKFTQMSTLVAHKRVHTKEKPFKCKSCNKSFCQSYTLKVHQRRHTGEKPFICNICKKSFIQQSTLNAHSRTHTGNKSYKCDMCNKKFTQFSSLKEHKRVHTDEARFECNYCHLTFSNWKVSIAHKRLHNGSTTFECITCQKIFNDQSLLKRHEKVHKERKPFKCNVCKLTYANPINFQNHTKIHYEAKELPSLKSENNMNDTFQLQVNKEFKCDLCNNIFYTQSQIVTHILSIHY
ncbi:zinc finger protein 271-like [Adelges cooleyi]|uniref:zinc finger protein 271-like n=1 Tax=Adelges cooleyi TaxID=133065 RepID=UPI00217FB00F|nr:zinc finger protein 271-like [Adelges cooleyi]XP_050421104.1 zinc finger protein 271-like [Adelges cooleyi]XP_050421105.1 zinc finger protein 271-like [Adelges cooleyi]XP_050421106.1 zinc finger protein 271-like [Adelges cooleyi]XP_050421107.1 zinc finger protein 271-like [Adelges cooleyi]